MLKFALLVLAFSVHASATLDLSRLQYNVDLRDLKNLPGLEVIKVIENDISQNTSKYFPSGTKYLSAGVTMSQTVEVNDIPGVEPVEIRNQVFGVEVSGQVVENQGQFQIPLLSFYQNKNQGFYFRKYQVQASLNGVSSVNVVDEFPLSQTRFEVLVGIAQRKVIFSDPVKGVTKVFPIAVGAIDDFANDDTSAPVKSMTPLIENGGMFKKLAIGKTPALDPLPDGRPRANYYKFRPFIPMARFDDQGAPRRRPEAFHIQQRTTIRGFYSHGCMHTREKDLYEIYTLISQSPTDYLPLKVRNWITDEPDHPLEIINGGFNRVVYYGSNTHGWERMKDPSDPSLTYTSWQSSPPPLGRLPK